ncbi:uncharacterized protein V2V93DRAFT_376614 [Kockiozyma suomiensis]|uniref:uncharacterized protein n=1 Tax=Kockiozyma suomiensis TaxID=1337062 RepID=UPI0033434D6E
MSGQPVDQVDDDDLLFNNLYGDETPALKEPIRRTQPINSSTEKQQEHDRQSSEEPLEQLSQNSLPPLDGYSNSNQGIDLPKYQLATQPMESDIGSSDDGKMFIGGLNWDTTDEKLLNYFSQFGQVTDCQVMRDPATGRSRGFGFLTFKDSKCVNAVMVKEHILDGKIIDPKRAIPKDEHERTSKIFVGGVAPGVTEPEFRQTFAQFGRVIDANLMIDKDTGRSRGFGFITFDGEAAVDNTLAHCPLVIGGKMVEVKKAQPRGAKEGYNDDTKMESVGGRQQSQYLSYDGRDYGADAQGDGTAVDYNNPESYPNGMTPSMMAQYWYRTQLYLEALDKLQANGYEPSTMAYAYQQQLLQQQQQQQQQQLQQKQRPQEQSEVFHINMSEDTMQKSGTVSQAAEPGGDSPVPTGPSNIPTGPSISIPKGPSASVSRAPVIPTGPASSIPKGPSGGPPTGPAGMQQHRERHHTPGSIGSPQSSEDASVKPPSGPKAFRSQQFTAPSGPRQSVPYNRGRGRGGYGRGGYHPYAR